MNYNTILAGVFLLIIFLIIGKILLNPLINLLKIMFLSVISLISLLTFNLIGTVIGLHIGLNFITVITVAIFGLPGICLILLLQVII